MKDSHDTVNKPEIGGGMSRGKSLPDQKPNNPVLSRPLDGQGKPDRSGKHSRVITSRDR